MRFRTATNFDSRLVSGVGQLKRGRGDVIASALQHRHPPPPQGMAAPIPNRSRAADATASTRVMEEASAAVQQKAAFRYNVVYNELYIVFVYLSKNCIFYVEPQRNRRYTQKPINRKL